MKKIWWCSWGSELRQSECDLLLNFGEFYFNIYFSKYYNADAKSNSDLIGVFYTNSCGLIDILSAILTFYLDFVLLRE